MDKPRPRGGRRPGAGAPKGNLNGLKHGLHSKQLAALGLAFASNPKLQQALLTLASRQQYKQRKAERVAAQIFAAMLKRGVEIKTEQQRRALNDLKDSIDRI